MLFLLACPSEPTSGSEDDATSTTTSDGVDTIVPGTDDGDSTTGEPETTTSSTSAAADSTSGGSSTDASDDASSESSTGAPPNFADPRGYTLIAPLDSRFTYLVDADHNVINEWESEHLPANAAYMLPNGHMLRVGRDPTPAAEIVSGAGGILEEYDWAGDLVWAYDHTGPDILAHHDIEPMPNGHVLVVAYDVFTADDAIAAGRDPDNVAMDGLWADGIVEIDPVTDTVVWEWHVWDHMVQDFAPAADNYGVVADSPHLIDINWTREVLSPRPDWTHVNAVAYDESLDQIVLSPRTFSEIWIIDHSTTTAEAATGEGGNAGAGGDLLYRWGNPATYQQGEDSDRDLYFQHNPRWIEEGKPGAGNLLIFDNGDEMLRPYSRVVELETPLLPDLTYAIEGAAYGPDSPTLVYEDPETFYSPFISGATRSSDGTTTICSGVDGLVFDVDAGGSVVWTLDLETSAFRAERYEADDPAWAGLTEEELAPKGPLVIDIRPPPR